MPRGLSALHTAELAKRVKTVALFVELALASGTVRVWNGIGTVSAGGFNWTGLGELGVIDGIETTRGGRAQNVSMSLVGLPSSVLPGGFIAQTRASAPQGRPLTVRIGFMTDAGALIGTLAPVWSGYADVLSFAIGENVTVSLTAEHVTARLSRPNGLRMTHESHQARLGNPSTADTFFRFQSRLAARLQALL